MHAIGQAWRSLRRSPGFALGAAATFALGVGINVAVFSSVDRLLFRPLPYPHGDRLFLIQQIDLTSGQRTSVVPARLVAEARAQLGFIEDLAILGDSSGYFETPLSEGLEVRVSFVTSRMLEVSGVHAITGRGFIEEDDRLERPVMLLTYEAWQGRFGGDPNILGRRFWYRDQSLEVIGVLPPGYIPSGRFIDPNAAGVARMATPTQGDNSNLLTLPPTVRLRAGVSRETAQAALDALVSRLTPPLPDTSGPQAIQLIPVREAMFGQYYSYLWLVIVAAAMVLVIACVNLAALFLVRARSRIREAAVRFALGASKGALIRDVLAEGALVCLAGAFVGTLLVALSGPALDAVLPPIFARFSSGVDGRVLAFALGATVTAGLLAAILPALLLNVHEVWRVVQGAAGPLGGGSPRRGRWLLATEAAIGVVLVAGVAVTGRNVSALSSAGLGFDPTDLQMVLAFSSAPAGPERYADLQEALTVVRNQPNVISAAAAPQPPIQRIGSTPFSKNGPPCCRWQITGDFMSTTGIPVLAGREISNEDVRSRAAVAVINQAALERLRPGRSPLEAIGTALALDEDVARQIVGVVGNTRRGHDDDLNPAVFVPVVPDRFNGFVIIARFRPGAPLRFSVLRNAIEVGGRRTLIYVRLLAPGYDRVMAGPRFRARLFGAFGAVALVIAMVGLFAVTSFDTESRRREMGIRLALGAPTSSIVRLVLLESGKPVMVGLAAGLGVALWAGSYLQPFLHGINPRDPWLLFLAALAMITSALVAAWMPAWRASRVDPTDVLKTP